MTVHRSGAAAAALAADGLLVACGASPHAAGPLTGPRASSNAVHSGGASQVGQLITVSSASSDALALAPDGKTAYAVEGSTSSLTPVTLPAGPAGSKISVGPAPNAVAITPDGKTAYVAIQAVNAGSVTPVDLATRKAGTPITVSTDPKALAITPDGKTVYVTLIGGQNAGTTMVPIDVATGATRSEITVGAYPNAIAIAPDGRTAYITNGESGTLTPVDLATGTAETPSAVGGATRQGSSSQPTGARPTSRQATASRSASVGVP